MKLPIHESCSDNLCFAVFDCDNSGFFPFLQTEDTSRDEKLVSFDK